MPASCWPPARDRERIAPLRPQRVELRRAALSRAQSKAGKSWMLRRREKVWGAGRRRARPHRRPWQPRGAKLCPCFTDEERSSGGSSAVCRASCPCPPLWLLADQKRGLRRPSPVPPSPHALNPEV